MSSTILLIALAGLVVLPVFAVVATYNRLVALDQRCETAFADIDVHLKHRQNLIPNLVETVRGFARHEHEILLGVARAQAEAAAAIAPEARLKAERDLTQSITSLIGVAERYPELLASGHFCALRDELVGAENRITAARRFYNLAVGEYGATLRQFPGSLVARHRNLEPRTPFDLGLERVLIDEPSAVKL
ncbi:LemA family protein [Methylobacterium nonmethylotrophicum]|uniref:LemA family protein n=1 Tax=Methylobacterium nonmethylotrophicum TaxID=1141884 RepID=A0A4Z0NXN1_9HYPH|nr:LemA family protein [Methylobacterium nonmethylotrophicum]TGE02246.1 LemA family protein [Methylobacterium nonmethylotrophicum]